MSYDPNLLPGVRYHKQREDGICVPIYMDGMADEDVQKNMFSAINEETRALRAAGHTVIGLDRWLK